MQQYLPEFHTALITISGAFMAITAVVVTLIVTRPKESPVQLSRKAAQTMFFSAILSLIFGGLAMIVSLQWFLAPSGGASFWAIWFLLGQVALVGLQLGTFIGALLRTR